ncbi:death domain-associated protein 6 [Pteropus medius]|uniref:death domain-associated protein 6 n=1 Tax=Pteropus vampyrus TaxID=132908 RepID=UPI00196B7BFD|nr:death domain-associated protein 6 [Pteropus giganteus]XP_039712169.1 death domain-associated protein 6 [Pteropus giganteus]XP_039712170.1 death domain-associated protein 6 [Pteropus giganteus]XP_039712171.1 death domain-associated protein 6 [Pteropus giganteus]XP_039712172.1 death domain-associated protein 6 [Pteropus giganteus]XP_039712173.1 death domain-associated protein 6 [Pteropus giganteus]XP_039712174.1 death domain-associated protein 6 [Pteropus giganteus]XP_039712175.1 death doma
MATANSIIVLDDDDEDEAAQPGPSHPAPKEASVSPQAEAPGSSQPHGAEGSGKKCYKLENEKLFEEFLELCKAHTADHPDVVPFLYKRQQRAHSLFLASAEFCNILSRVLSRAQSRPAKLYVYINELCTVLKAHSAKKKLNLAPAATTPSEPSGSNPSTDPSLDPTNAETTGSEAPRTRGSRRQIQRLEQLLALYVAEIRRLQEKELDLKELDDPDSTYLQEARLKRKLIRLFGRLCELKDCSSLTGRVIEQRIPYRGTRYPEVNRRIERLINKPGPDTFPDYGDVLRAVEKAAARHSLGLPRQQLQLMAQDAFRDVGIRLQERRHLDLIYNFGCHLTDDYRPGIDPALSDPALARRLRENRSLAMSRLDEVISKYAMMQDKSEEGERQKRRARLPQATSSHSTDPPKASLDSGEGPSGMASQECPTTSKVETDDGEDEESEEEEEEEVTDSEEEEDLEQMQEGQGDDEEEEEEAGKDGERSPMSPPQISPEKNLEPSQGINRSSGEQQNKGLRVSSSPLSEEPLATSSIDAESNGEYLEELPLEKESPVSQVFELEIEALTVDTTPSPEEGDISSSRKQSEDPLTTVLENGAAMVTSTSFNGGVSPHTWRDSSPPCKKSRKERQMGAGPLGNSFVEGHEKTGKKICTLPHPPSPLASMAPVADSSTRVDSPSHGLVTSSLCSPSPARLTLNPQSQPSQSGTYKMSVATQCDPEEIIVLSDSD